MCSIHLQVRGCLGYKSLDLIITLQVILITTTWLRCAVPSGRELMGDHIERLRSLPQIKICDSGWSSHASFLCAAYFAIAHLAVRRDPAGGGTNPAYKKDQKRKQQSVCGDSSSIAETIVLASSTPVQSTTQLHPQFEISLDAARSHRQRNEVVSISGSDAEGHPLD